MRSGTMFIKERRGDTYWGRTENINKGTEKFLSKLVDTYVGFKSNKKKFELHLPTYT